MIKLDKVKINNFHKLVKINNINTQLIELILYTLFLTNHKIYLINFNNNIIGFIIFSYIVKPIYLNQYIIDNKYKYLDCDKLIFNEIFRFLKQNKIKKLYCSHKNIKFINLLKDNDFDYTYTESFGEIYNKFGEYLMLKNI